MLTVALDWVEDATVAQVVEFDWLGPATALSCALRSAACSL